MEGRSHSIRVSEYDNNQPLMSGTTNNLAAIQEEEYILGVECYASTGVPAAESPNPRI